VNNEELKVTDGATAGAWIPPRLGGEFGAVTLQVPQDFEAYARIFHPASDSAGDPVKWANVAKACGTIPHGEMQWHAILGLAHACELGRSYDPDHPSETTWVGSDPLIGAMDIETLDTLCQILAIRTTDATHCFFGLCTIQNWLDSFSTVELQPLLKLPHGRDYIVLAGALAAVNQIRYDRSVTTPPHSLEYIRREAPNLIWPADHTWLVATEVDFDSTLVGGSAKLIEAIIQSPTLEAWTVDAATSLAADADQINQVKDPH
jgi:hypothetical protein